MARNLDVVRHELCGRIAALEGAGPADKAGAVAEIRAIAVAAGLLPAVTVTRFLAAALARGEGMGAWLPMLRDAVGCDQQDAAACDAYAAACAVRLAA